MSQEVLGNAEMMSFLQWLWHSLDSKSHYMATWMDFFGISCFGGKIHGMEGPKTAK